LDERSGVGAIQGEVSISGGYGYHLS
jgi:hypothetical protein